MPRKFTFTTQVYDTRADFPATGDVDVIYIDASKNTAYRYDVDYYAISSAEVNIWGALGSVSKGGGGGGGASWGDITGTLSSQTDLQSALDAKQDDLVSGTNIKTINGSSILGSGDLVVSGGGASGFNTPVPFGSGGIYSNIPFGSSNVTFSSVANQIYLMPFIPNVTFTTTNIFFNVTSAALSTNARILIYSHSTTTRLPNTKLFESTDINVGTTGVKTLTTAQTFTKGVVYWIGYYTNGNSILSASSAGTQLIIGSDSLTNTYNSVQLAATYGSAPASFGSSATRNASNFIRISLTSA